MDPYASHPACDRNHAYNTHANPFSCHRSITDMNGCALDETNFLNFFPLLAPLAIKCKIVRRANGTALNKQSVRGRTT